MNSFIRDNKLWFACCYFLSKLHLSITRQFPTNPGCTEILNAQSIIDYINSSGYYQSAMEIIQALAPAQIDMQVNSAIAKIEQIYDNNKQFFLFPGKEVFRDIRGVLPGSNYADSQTMDIDLTKEIAAYQVKNKGIPEELTKIKHTILAR